MIFQLFYKSTAKISVTLDDIQDIVVTAKEINAKKISQVVWFTLKMNSINF